MLALFDLGSLFVFDFISFGFIEKKPQKIHNSSQNH